MVNCDLFKQLTEQEFQKIYKCFEIRNIFFKKDQTILSNTKNAGTVGVIISGDAQLVRVDYKGTRTLLAEYAEGDTFGAIFSNISNGEVSVQAKTDCEIMFVDYEHIINRCKKNCPYHNTVIQNMIDILAKRIYVQNERIEILTKRSTREKLLEYFHALAKKSSSKTVYVPFTYTDLADYLSIDRAAMMRELKYLKDDGIIRTKGRMVKLITM